MLSNAVPQHQSVNSGRWSQLEARIRHLAAQSEAVIIFTGPIYDSPDPTVIGEGRVAVPTHLYKVVLAIRDNHLTMLAAIIPNQPSVREPLDSYFTSVDHVESRTGLDFFAALDDALESRLESQSVGPDRGRS